MLLNMFAVIHKWSIRTIQSACSSRIDLRGLKAMVYELLEELKTGSIFVTSCNFFSFFFLENGASDKSSSLFRYHYITFVNVS